VSTAQGISVGGLGHEWCFFLGAGPEADPTSPTSCTTINHQSTYTKVLKCEMQKANDLQPSNAKTPTSSPPSEAAGAEGDQTWKR